MKNTELVKIIDKINNKLQFNNFYYFQQRYYVQKRNP